MVAEVKVAMTKAYDVRMESADMTLSRATNELEVGARKSIHIEVEWPS